MRADAGPRLGPLADAPTAADRHRSGRRLCAVAAPGVPPEPVTVTWSACGRIAVPDITWLLDNRSGTASGRGAQWVCPACVRAHSRAIEARLDQEWW